MIFVDMDGVLAEWQVGKDNEIYNEGYFLNLKANKILIDFLNNLHAKGEKIAILSAFLADSEYALLEKMKWVYRNIPFCETYFVPCGKSKAKYIQSKGFVFSKDLILIDDHSANLLEWDKAGGRAIKFLNGINGKGKQWKGEKISNDTLNEIFGI